MEYLEAIRKIEFNYIDLIVVALLVMGFLHGRKRGISQELLTFLQWIVILFAGAVIYEPAGDKISEMAPFSKLTCYLIAYITFALLVKLIFVRSKQLVGEKLVTSNVFGSFEYYLGMLAGPLRFGCAILVFMALLNARLITEKERADTAKMQNQNFEGVSFPTFGSFQQSVLYKSFVGRSVRNHLSFVLIEATPAAVVPIPRNESDDLNEIFGKR